MREDSKIEIPLELASYSRRYSISRKVRVSVCHRKNTVAQGLGTMMPHDDTLGFSDGLYDKQLLQH